MPKIKVFCGKCRHFRRSPEGQECVKAHPRTIVTYFEEYAVPEKPAEKNAHNDCGDFEMR